MTYYYTTEFLFNSGISFPFPGEEYKSVDDAVEAAKTEMLEDSDPCVYLVFDDKKDVWVRLVMNIEEQKPIDYHTDERFTLPVQLKPDEAKEYAEAMNNIGWSIPSPAILKKDENIRKKLDFEDAMMVLPRRVQWQIWIAIMHEMLMAELAWVTMQWVKTPCMEYFSWIVNQCRYHDFDLEELTRMIRQPAWGKQEISPNWNNMLEYVEDVELFKLPEE